MAGIPKIRIVEDTTVSIEQHHTVLTGAKHRVRVAKQQVCVADKGRATQSVTTQPVQAVGCGHFSAWFALC